ncbi:endonuclease domain-containing protein [Fusobacteria bacterium ZRK30]|nr:endonuclease domain-containing protein [Fusobacteria bacterium ZRK30]
MEIFNLKKSKSTKNRIKKDLTAEEKQIWNYIKDRKLYNLKFKKQTEIGKYTANFYCPEIEFIIEIDNDKHTIKYEKTREEYFQSIGITSLRFTSSEIKSDLNEILKKIEAAVGNLKN